MTEGIALELAIELLRAARRIVVFSGAGLSKASGIPTYRDADGLWMNQAALRFSHAEDLARDPAGFTKFWAERLRVVEAAEPNPAHLALARLQRLRPSTRLVTQNVDGLLTRAGAVDVLELHGALQRWRCDHCGNRRGPWLFQRCIRCGRRARPDVVMFGEMLNQGVLLDAQVAARGVRRLRAGRQHRGRLSRRGPAPAGARQRRAAHHPQCRAAGARPFGDRGAARQGRGRCCRCWSTASVG